MLLAFVVAIVFAAGLSLIVEALDFLFDVRPYKDLHEHIWGTAATLIAPLYGLSLMPRDLDEEIVIAHGKNSLLERGVSVLLNYVLVPVVVVYALILHAYAVKILLQGELPRGQVAMMVSIFALGGTAAWLVAWPWHEQGTRLLRLFMRGWFFLAIVPTVLLVIAIWRRLSDYGVTPDRYGIVLVAIWIAFITIYLAFRRNRADIRAILGGLAILLLVGSVGPFGAYGLTISSQVTRLQALLESNGVLKDGKVVLPLRGLLSEHARAANSMIYALADVDGIDRLKPWFNHINQVPFVPRDSRSRANAVAQALGVGHGRPPETLSFYARGVFDRKLAGPARLVGPLHGSPSPEVLPSPSATIKGGQLIIKIDDRSWQVPVEDIMNEARAINNSSNKQQPHLVFEVESELTLVFERLQGELYAKLGEKPKLQQATFWVILK